MLCARQGSAETLETGEYLGEFHGFGPVRGLDRHPHDVLVGLNELVAHLHGQLEHLSACCSAIMASCTSPVPSSI